MARILKTLKTDSRIEISFGFSQAEMRLSLEIRMLTDDIPEGEISNMIDEFNNVSRTKRLDKGGKGIAFLISKLIAQ